MLSRTSPDDGTGGGVADGTGGGVADGTGDGVGGGAIRCAEGVRKIASQRNVQKSSRRRGPYHLPSGDK